MSIASEARREATRRLHKGEMLSAAKKQVSEDDRLQLDPKKHVTAEDLEGVLSDVDTQGLSSVDMVRKMRDE